MLTTYNILASVPETVIIHDLNTDHTERHFDAGLSTSLNFRMKRETGSDVVLQLSENKRLNENAPVYDVVVDEEGNQRVVKRSTEDTVRIEVKYISRKQ